MSGSLRDLQDQNGRLQALDGSLGKFPDEGWGALSTVSSKCKPAPAGDILNPNPSSGVFLTCAKLELLETDRQPVFGALGTSQALDEIPGQARRTKPPIPLSRPPTKMGSLCSASLPLNATGLSENAPSLRRQFTDTPLLCFCFPQLQRDISPAEAVNGAPHAQWQGYWL